MEKDPLLSLMWVMWLCPEEMTVFLEAQGVPHTCPDLVTDHGYLSESTPSNWKKNPLLKVVKAHFLPRGDLYIHLLLFPFFLPCLCHEGCPSMVRVPDF